MDELRSGTRCGRFDPGDVLMRELEYHRFVSECRRQRDWPDAPDHQRALFESLTSLGEPRDDPVELTEEDVREVPPRSV